MPHDALWRVFPGYGEVNERNVPSGLQQVVSVIKCARSAKLRQQWGAGKDDPVMILVGRIAEEKNLDLTLAAFERMRAKAPDLKFVMVGDGPARSRISKQYPEIIMAGVRTGKDLAAHYASADVFVFCSKTETFGNVVLEAMASGLGLVAFDYAAASQHVRDGETGLLATLDRNDALIDAASMLVENPSLLQHLRMNAASYAEGQSWASIISDLEHILTGEPATSAASGTQPVSTLA